MNYETQAQYYEQAGVQASSRDVFILKTYMHLMGAIAFFIGLEVFYFQTGMNDQIFETIASMHWLVIMGIFMGASFLAQIIAQGNKPKALQYMGLALYAFVWSLLFAFLLTIAVRFAPEAIQQASLVTAIAFCGLSAIAFITKKDFSFLKGIIFWGFILAACAIVGGVLIGFDLGLWFSVGMVGLIGATILYETSNIIHHYREDQYVGAALQLFASVMLMLWYLMQIFMSMSGDD